MLIQDLRYGLRLYRKAAGLSLIAVIALALGVGASTAIFSVVNAILLKPLPYANAERIVIPWRLVPAGLNLGYDELPWGVQDFHLLSKLRAFQDIAAFKGDAFNLTGKGEPALLRGLRVSAGFFRVLGVPPILGRTLTAKEDQPGREHEVLLSYRLWQDRFGGSRSVLGSAADLDGQAYTVIGVMPPGFSFPRAEEMPASFTFPKEADIWVPLAAPAVVPPNQPSDLAVMILPRPNVTLAQAQEQTGIFAKRQEQQFPRFKGWFNSRVVPLTQQVVGDTQRPLLLLLGAVGVVLLIACFNVANLLLGRFIERKREFTLRAALGAGYGRLMRQLLTESLLLATAGGILGSLIAEAGIHFLRIFGPADIPRIRDVSIDFRVLAFTVAITLATAVLFGLAPTVSTIRGNLVEAIKEGGQRSGSGAATSRLRDLLLVSQMTFALVLVVVAALLVQTFFRLQRVDAGFNASQVLTFVVSLPSSKYSDPQRIAALYSKALKQLQALPGVQSGGLVYTVPMDGATESGVIRILDHPSTDDKQQPFSEYTIASPGYFSAVGSPLLRGRDFIETDTAETVPVTIINNAMAKKYWPGEDPIGKQVGLGSPRFPAMTIVGIVTDIKHLSLRETPEPEMYVPYTQKPYPSMLTMHFVLRTKSSPRSVLVAARRAINSLDADLPVAQVTTLKAIVDNSMSRSRFSMLVLGAFGALAVLLACIGMYGVIAFGVAQRTREIGIRMAMGAQRWDMFRMILMKGARLAGIGIVIGVLAAINVTRLLAGFLYGVRATDLLTFITVSLLLVAVALLACLFPARRATRIDPMIALRYE